MTQSRHRSGSFRSWSTFFTTRPKSRSGALEILPIAPHTSGSNRETSSSAPVPPNSGSEPIETPNTRPNDPPSYAHAISRSKPTSYRFVQNSGFSMDLVTQDGSQNTAYNIGVGVNVWMPSEHITLLRRHANQEGPVLARLESVKCFHDLSNRLIRCSLRMGITSASATVTIGDQTMLLTNLMPGIHSSSSCVVSSPIARV